jgi:hypothetical protein
MVHSLRLARNSASELGVGAFEAEVCAVAVKAVRQAAMMQLSRVNVFDMI